MQLMGREIKMQNTNMATVGVGSWWTYENEKYIKCCINSSEQLPFFPFKVHSGFRNFLYMDVIRLYLKKYTCRLVKAEAVEVYHKAT